MTILGICLVSPSQLEQVLVQPWNGWREQFTNPKAWTIAFPYSHVLLLGATSGIGLAMADKMLQHNIRVTAMGRRQGRLDAWVQQSGANRAHGVALDISQIDAIPRMAME